MDEIRPSGNAATPGSTRREAPSTGVCIAPSSEVQTPDARNRRRREVTRRSEPQGRPGPRRHRSAGQQAGRDALARAHPDIVAGLWLALMVLAALRYLRAGPVPLTPNYEIEQINKGVSAERLLLPPKGSLLWGWWSADIPVNQVFAPVRKVAFLGYVAVLLLLTVCVVARGSPAWWSWLASGLFFILLSFGPDLLFFEQRTGVLLPDRFLPDVGVLRAPNRFMPTAVLCVGVAVAIAWAHLLRWLRSAAVGTAVTVVLAVVLLLEYASLPFPTIEPAISPFYRRLAAESGEFGLVELPQQSRQHDKLYMFYQIFRGKPLHARHLSRKPEGTDDFLNSVELLRVLDRASYPGGPPAAVDVVADLRRLAASRFRYVIFHKQFDEGMFDGWSEAEERIAADVSRTVGGAAYQDDRLVAFDLRRLPTMPGDGAGRSSPR